MESNQNLISKPVTYRVTRLAQGLADVVVALKLIAASKILATGL